MTWLCPFIRSRKSKSNFLDDKENEENVNGENFSDENVNRDEAVGRDDESEEEDDNDDDNESLFSQERLASPTQSHIQSQQGENSWKRKENDPLEKSASKKKKKPDKTTDQSKSELMSSISLYMKSRAEKPAISSVPKTEDEIFGSMVAMQMRKLHGIFKAQAQHEINNTLFRFIMTQENAKALSTQSPFNQNVNVTPTQSGTFLNRQLSSSSSSVTSPTSSFLPDNGNLGWVSL